LASVDGMRFRHVALFVGGDLRGAESYYSHLFDMAVAVREALLPGADPAGDEWGQLPIERSWEDADAAGVEIGMVALQREDVVLALFAVEPTGVQYYAIGLVLEADGIEAIADRLTEEAVESRDEGWLAFVDRYGMRWQLSATAPFLGSGVARGQWLDV
jgi:hypothetical protein